MKKDYRLNNQVSQLLFGPQVKKKLNDNVDKLVRQVNINAKNPKIIPVATGKTLASVRMERLGTQTWKLSSINYEGMRYDAKGNTKSYTAYQGAIKIRIPAYKNYGKNKWFDKSFNDLDKQGKVSNILLDIYN